MSVIGQCKLCLQSDAELQDSHYLSKGIYKRLRDERAKNPNPYLITKTNSLQTSVQLKRPLLCKPCEARQNSRGEAWVLRHCLQGDGTFPLRDILSGVTPDLQSPGGPTRMYKAANIPEIRAADLAYFAASIFWRGSLYPWNDDGSVPIDLGPFQDAFRLYLMGQAAFPSAACLWVIARERGDIEQFTYTPTQARVEGVHLCRFPMPGLAFMLFVSKNMPASYRRMCFVSAHGNPLFLTSVLERLILDEGVRMLAAQRKDAV
jgi:hypothetical protein